MKIKHRKVSTFLANRKRQNLSLAEDDLEAARSAISNTDMNLSLTDRSIDLSFLPESQTERLRIEKITENQLDLPATHPAFSKDSVWKKRFILLSGSVLGLCSIGLLYSLKLRKKI